MGAPRRALRTGEPTGAPRMTIGVRTGTELGSVIPACPSEGSAELLSAGALAVCAPWPAAGPTLAFFQLLLGPANAAFSSHLLLGILHPADELVTGQRRDVHPGNECRGVRDQRLAQVSWKLVHHSTGHSRAAHGATVAGQCERFSRFQRTRNVSETAAPSLSRRRALVKMNQGAPSLSAVGRIRQNSIALGISENLPSVSDVNVLGRRSPERLRPGNRAFEVSDAEVQVHAVLHRLGLRHPEEEQWDGIRIETDVAIFIDAHGATE